MRRTLNCLAVFCFSLLSLSMNSPLRSLNAECPTITVDCPTQLVEPGETFSVTANVAGADPKLKLSYYWSLSAGTISAGQGTMTITAAKPCNDQTITATVEIVGLDSMCQSTASCSLPIDGIPVSRKFDEYRAMAFEEEKVHLDRFAVQLKNEPGARGYIVFYNGLRANARQARRRANRSRMYLINTNGIDAKRLVAVKGGENDEIAIELWIVPQGAAVPPDFIRDVPKCPKTASLRVDPYMKTDCRSFAESHASRLRGGHVSNI